MDNVTAQVIARVKPDHEHCRVYGHRWDSQRIEWTDNAGYYVEVLACDRCECERHDYVNLTTGLIGKRAYRYPEAYTLDGGMSFTSEARGALRLRKAARQIENRHTHTSREIGET